MRRLVVLLAALVTCSTLTIPLPAATAAEPPPVTQTISVRVEPGPLLVLGSVAPVRLSGLLWCTGTTAPVRVVDARGSDGGWDLVVHAAAGWWSVAAAGSLLDPPPVLEAHRAVGPRGDVVLRAVPGHSAGTVAVALRVSAPCSSARSIPVALEVRPVQP